ncbi:sugar phosphate isomerase/epimerase family protein [Novosphingobium sp. ZW T3_23]|uniref:sugar phosphate isomerase/epimerase family protein n=1 Tax=Novosphingobium sp. ZW T3_23 TaxID=3378084 RepID=UPI003853AE1A
MQFDRRTLISGLTLSACAAMLPKSLSAAVRSGFFQRRRLPVGIQLYMLGPEVAKDLDATFTRLAAIGFREIELPGLYGRKPAELSQAAARAGLQIASLHLPLVQGTGLSGLSLGSEPGRIADALGALGAKWAVAPLLMLPSGFRPLAGEGMEAAITRSVTTAGIDIWKQTAAILNEKGAALKSSGFRVAYHNHNLEFAPIGSTNGWNILWEETQADLVSFEIDIGWVAAAGLDAVDFLRRMAPRARLLHIKDLTADSPRNYGLKMVPADIGAGSLDLSRILPAAYAAGVRHFLVEQEPPFKTSRIAAAETAFAFLKDLKA